MNITTLLAFPIFKFCCHNMFYLQQPLFDNWNSPQAESNLFTYIKLCKGVRPQHRWLHNTFPVKSRYCHNNNLHMSFLLKILFKKWISQNCILTYSYAFLQQSYQMVKLLHLKYLEK